MGRIGSRIGMSVAEDSVCAVVLRRGRITWAGEVPWDGMGSVSAAVAELLSRVPRSRLGRPCVSLAVGPRWSHVKCIRRLPDNCDEALVRRIVRESSSAFFPALSAELLTGGMLAIGEEVWAAGIDARLVDAVSAGCVQAHARLDLAIPTALALLGSTESSAFSWVEGRIRLDVEHGSDILRVRRLRADAPHARQDVTPCPELQAWGDDCRRLAAAFGAGYAASSPVAAAALRLATDRRASWRELRTPAVVALLAVIALLLSPWRAVVAVSHETAALRELRASEAWMVADSAHYTLTQLHRLLHTADSFSRADPALPHLLSELARELPQDVVVMELRLGASGGELTGRAGSAAEFVAALRRITAFETVELLPPSERPHPEPGAAMHARVAVGIARFDQSARADN